MFLRLCLLGFCFSVLVLSVSSKQDRSLAGEEKIQPTYDASYKL
jgi:hypothetical protein